MGQPSRVIVVNFSPEARGLTAAIVDFFGPETVELTCVGVVEREAAEEALEGIDKVAAVGPTHYTSTARIASSPG